MASLLQRLRSGKPYGYETFFLNQDRRIVGKPGVILADMGMPENYEFAFYRDYIRHVFEFSLPAFIRSFVLADRGIVLLDPDNPLARAPFRPKRLIDAHGSTCNRHNRPYVECLVAWRPPAMRKNPWDHGYFLYKEEGPGGAPDICQKAGAKIVGWYYGKLLPERKIAWAYQCGRIYQDAVARLRARFPQAEYQHARYHSVESLQDAVEKLLAAGCGTIIYHCFSNPVYSDLEEFSYALPLIHRIVAGRARVVCAGQLGDQPALRAGYLQMLSDQLAQIPPEASILVILSTHGHPFKRESMEILASTYRRSLEAGAREIMAARRARWEVTWSCDEYADEYWDRRHHKVSTFDLYRRAISEEFDFAIELPTEFLAENTDQMIFHAMRKFGAFAEYDRNEPVPYPDWDRPLIRRFRQGRTTGICAGSPVGPYRRYVVEAVIDTLSPMLQPASGG